MRILFVVPALNEERSLPALIGELKGAAATLGIEGTVMVIDDGSSDHTAEVSLASGARVVRLCRNLGIGGAVQCGLRVALREGFDAAIQVDGDGQHPASELHKLIKALDDKPAPDLVLGTRYLTNEGFRSTVLRRFGGWWLRMLLRILGLKVSDPTSGFRLYNERALKLFDQTYPYDFPEPEALALARAVHLRIVEVPVAMRERQGGKSSINALNAPYYMLKVSIAVLLSYFRNRRPLPPEGES